MPKRIIFNVSNEAHATITTAAAKLNLTITEYICKCCKVKPLPMGRPWHKEKEPKDPLDAALNEIEAIIEPRTSAIDTPPENIYAHGVADLATCVKLTDWSDPKYDRCATCGHTRAVHTFPNPLIYGGGTFEGGCGWDDDYGRVMCDCEGFEPLRKESR